MEDIGVGSIGQQQNSGDDNYIEPINISILQGDAIVPADLVNLRQGGFNTVESIAFSPKKNLLLVTGINGLKADNLLLKASKLLPMGFVTAQEQHQYRVEIVRIGTGSRDLDLLLGGGIEPGSITEVFGESGSGKTQLCHTLAVTCQLAKGCKKCLYIDTSGTFRPERLLAIAARFGIPEADVLENVVVARAHSTDEQFRLLNHATKLMLESRFSLLVVDSAMKNFRAEFVGVPELAARQQNLGLFLRMLIRLADEFKIAVVITNEVVAEFDVAQRNNSTTKPAGGHVMAHTTTTRLSLAKEGNLRTCTVYSSPCLPERGARFVITASGINDVGNE